MNKLSFTDCVYITETVVKNFDGTKKYVSTGALDCDHIDYSQVEEVTYDSKPSRANLTAHAGDILFAKMQGTKKTIILDAETKEHIYSTGFCAVKPKPEVITNRCLYHLISSAEFLHQKDKYCSGATQKAITNSGLQKIIISIPDIAKQSEIADCLDLIDYATVICNQILKLFDQLVKSRFVELFGDILCNDKGWPIYSLDSISSSRLGKMLDAKQNTGKNSFPYLANFNVQWFEFDLSKLHEMDFTDAEREEFSLKDGDLLITEGGEVGRCAIWHNEIPNCYFQKALHRVRCDKNIILPEYLAWWFKFHSDFNGFEDIVGGKATIAHLPGVKLKKLQIEVPDINVQKDFVLFWRKIDKSKSVIKECLQKTEYLKSALMQKYFG